jgi:hypothetical protein
MHVIFSEFGAQVMKHNRLFSDDVSRANTVATVKGYHVASTKLPGVVAIACCWTLFRSYQKPPISKLNYDCTMKVQGLELTLVAVVTNKPY